MIPLDHHLPGRPWGRCASRSHPRSLSLWTEGLQGLLRVWQQGGDHLSVPQFLGYQLNMFSYQFDRDEVILGSAGVNAKGRGLGCFLYQIGSPNLVQVATITMSSDIVPNLLLHSPTTFTSEPFSLFPERAEELKRRH